MPHIVSLRQAAEHDLGLIGGKAWNLSRLLRAGVPVPDGFCITAKAFDSFVADPTVAAVVREVQRQLSSDSSVDTARRVSSIAQRRLAASAVPASVRTAIGEHYAELCRLRSSKPMVAVRSSAVDEDAAETSFAGQHKTFLNIDHVDDIIKSTFACWLSLWTPGALFYRCRRGIPIDIARMAVIVQEMVDSRISGVVFTSDPISGDRERFVINAARGLGEGIVSGNITPVELSIPKRRRFFGLVRWWLLWRPVTAGVLTPKEVEQVLRVAGEIENLFEVPQDIEWAYENKTLYILQARPITTTIRPRLLTPRGVWTRRGLGEWLQRPLSPIFSTLILPRFAEYVERLLATRWGLSQRRPTWITYGNYFYSRLGLVMDRHLFSFPRRFLRELDGAAGEYEQSFVPKYLDELRRLSKVDVQGLEPHLLFAHLENLVELAGLCWAWTVFTGINAKVSAVVFRGAMRIVPARISSQNLLGGCPNKSIEADEALWRLAELARSENVTTAKTLQENFGVRHEDLDGDESLRRWQDRFEEWLQLYGHRVFDLDISVPTLQDQPILALELVGTYLENRGAAPETKRALAARRAEKAELALAAWLCRKPKCFRMFYRRTTERARKYTTIREDRPFYLHMTWPLLRKALLEMGKRLRRRGLIESADSIFFLRAEELRVAVSLLADSSGLYPPFAEDLAARIEEFERSKLLTPPQDLHAGRFLRLVGHLVRLLKRLRERDQRTLYGSAGSPGIAQGRARIVSSEVDFGCFQMGEVLVAPYTTPAWTPLLSLAAAAVTEVGGSLSHAAIIAREYGIPAVVGVENLLERVQNGVYLEVDGRVGTVRFVESREKGEDSGVEETTHSG